MEQYVTIKGIYLGQQNDRFVFELENGDVLDFEIHDDRILKTYNLFSSVLVRSKFEIVYEEILEESISFELKDLIKIN
ncbi:MAG: hypothetical protein ACPGSD_00820 [Flavobacteriales bacterium]